MYKNKKVSNELQVSVLIGTIYKDNNQIYNRAVLFRPEMKTSHYDKRALWGWDKDNFSAGENKGIIEFGDIKIGIRICFEVRFPEYFRELYREKTDINIVIFYDVSDYQCHSVNRFFIKAVYHNLPNIENTVQLENSRINKWTFTSTTGV